MNNTGNENNDGIITFYNALNEKLIYLSNQISKADVDITNTDDKTYDRVFKMMVEGGKIAENMLTLRKYISSLDGQPVVNDKIKKHKGVAI